MSEGLLENIYVILYFRVDFFPFLCNNGIRIHNSKGDLQ